MSSFRGTSYPDPALPAAPYEGCVRPNAPLVGTGDPNNADPALDYELQGRSLVTSPCNSIPTGAELLVGNATSVWPAAGGWLTIYPSGGASRPVIASSNYAGSDVINGPFTVRLGANGKFKVYTLQTTDLVIDILGYFSSEATDANGTGMLFNPLAKPVRLLETRSTPSSLPGCYKTLEQILPGYLNPANHHPQATWGTCEGITIPNQAQAIVGNATVTNQAGAGFLTFWPENVSVPLVATSNYPVSVSIGGGVNSSYSRHFFVGLSPIDGKFKLLSQAATDLRVDVSGYFAP